MEGVAGTFSPPRRNTPNWKRELRSCTMKINSWCYSTLGMENCL
jgi:hypothetical protein